MVWKLRERRIIMLFYWMHFGLEDIDIFEKSEKEYDVESVKKNIQSLSDKVKEEEKVSLVIMC